MMMMMMMMVVVGKPSENQRMGNQPTGFRGKRIAFGPCWLQFAQYLLILVLKNVPLIHS